MVGNPTGARHGVHIGGYQPEAMLGHVSSYSLQYDVVDNTDDDTADRKVRLTVCCLTPVPSRRMSTRSPTPAWTRSSAMICFPCENHLV